MKRFIVLGSSGMLGSEVSRVAKQKNLNLLEISRGGEIGFKLPQIVHSRETKAATAKMISKTGMISTEFRRLQEKSYLAEPCK